jgi:MFS transporter, SHS family, lactate transporter
MRIEALSGWTSEQKHVVAATFLGCALDAFGRLGTVSLTA